ncbi:MAG: hypothetical protein AAF798_19600 [Bacteroidota bacterium]
MISKARIERGFDLLFGDKVKHTFERTILILGIVGFFVHLGLVYISKFGWITFSPIYQEFFKSPISAIYTPFSFILVFEVYQLIYYLPRSFTISIGKQYEIIALIIIRRIFKDISNLELSGQWFDDKYNILLTGDMIGFLGLLFLIFWFNKLSQKRPKMPSQHPIESFITIKKGVALVLVPLLAILSFHSLGTWLYEVYQINRGLLDKLDDINKIFYDEFFTLLILVDVFILMISLLYTDRFSQLVRNSGFVISTILIRLSFSASGLTNMSLILAGVLFGTLNLLIYNHLRSLKAKSDLGDEL